MKLVMVIKTSSTQNPFTDMILCYTYTTGILLQGSVNNQHNYC